MIKIVTGVSEMGGSTVAHINLCNLFNRNGHDCTLYGPDDWHVGKCKSERLPRGGVMLSLQPDDILVWHFITPPETRPKVSKFVLSLHEKHVYPLKRLDYTVFDVIHYVSEDQRKWHGVDHPYFVCGNVIDDLKPNKKACSMPTAGVIGSIDPNKRPEMSVQRALADGFKDIRLFGKLIPAHKQYYEERISPLVRAHSPIIKDIIMIDDKQAMYDQVTDVYLSSISECTPYVVSECIRTGTSFHGTPPLESYRDNLELEDEAVILEKWISNMGLNR